MTLDPLQPLAAEALARRCDPASISFETTAALEAPFAVVGQERAAQALAFGIGVAHEGSPGAWELTSGLPQETVNRRVAARLREFAAQRRERAVTAGGGLRRKERGRHAGR